MTTNELKETLTKMFPDRRIELVEESDVDHVLVHCHDSIIGFHRMVQLFDLATKNDLMFTVSRGFEKGLVVNVMRNKVQGEHDGGGTK